MLLLLLLLQYCMFFGTNDSHMPQVDDLCVYPKSKPEQVFTQRCWCIFSLSFALSLVILNLNSKYFPVEGNYISGANSLITGPWKLFNRPNLLHLFGFPTIKLTIETTKAKFIMAIWFFSTTAPHSPTNRFIEQYWFECVDRRCLPLHFDRNEFECRPIDFSVPFHSLCLAYYGFYLWAVCCWFRWF